MCTDAEEKAGLYWRGKKEDRDARGAASWHQVKRLRISNTLFFTQGIPGGMIPLIISISAVLKKEKGNKRLRWYHAVIELPRWRYGKEPPASVGGIRYVGLISGSGRSPGGGNGNHSSILRSPLPALGEGSVVCYLQPT